MSKNPEKNLWMINPELLYTFRFVWHELRKIVERRHKGSKFNDKPMTGWTTTMMAMQMCDSVDLYGFQPYRGKSENDRYHYFDNQVHIASVCPHHTEGSLNRTKCSLNHTEFSLNQNPNQQLLRVWVAGYRSRSVGLGLGLCVRVCRDQSLKNKIR
jgi:hypothetical protein